MLVTKRRTFLVVLAATLAAAGLMGGAPFAEGHSVDSQPAKTQSLNAQRVTAWAPSMTTGGPNFHDQTIRMVAHSSVEGTALRIHLSNLRSTIPLTVGAVSIAAQADRATAVAGSQRTATFSHKRSVTIAAG